MFTQITKNIIYFIAWLCVRIFLLVCYRIKSTNINVPKTGSCIVVSNHITFLDAFIIIATAKRKMRFVVYEPIYRNILARPFFWSANSIPITGARENPAVLKKAMTTIHEALRNGECVMIFPEGQLTRDGEFSTFKPGVERIIKETPCPVYPVAISNLYGSYFSRCPNRKWYGKAFQKITIAGGQLISPENVTTNGLLEVITTLRTKP